MKKILFLFAVVIAQPVLADTVMLTQAQLNSMNIKLVLPVQTSMQVHRYTGEVSLPTAQVRIVSAPQQGLVDAMHVATGQIVKKGQVIAHLSSPDLIGLQGEYLQLQTKKKLAASALARDTELLKDGIIAQRRYLETQSAHEELNAALAEKKQALRLAGMGDGAISRLNTASGLQSGMAIVAPISGQIVEQMSNVGQRVDSAVPLYKIANLNPLWVEMNVPVEEALKLKTGLQVQVPKSNASGRVVGVLRNVDKASQTMQVRVEITQGAENLALGQFVEAEIQSGTSAGYYAVPRVALIRNGKQTIIFKQTNQGFETVPVHVIAEQGESATVSGLAGNEKVAITGLVALKGVWLGLGGQ